MRNSLSVVALFAFLMLAGSAQAQLRAPAASPLGSVSQRIGLTDVVISYSRPGVKGRVIFGGLLTYGELWRTGANAATTIQVTDEVLIAGNAVPAGTYALFTIPDEDKWTIILNKNADQGGTGDYDPELDLFRFEVEPKMMKDHVETLTFDFQDINMTGATIQMKWDKVLIEFPIEVEVDEKMDVAISEALDPKSRANDYFQAARYYYQAGRDLNKALEWVDLAIKLRDDAYWMHHQKAKILARMGKKKEAIKAAEKSKEVALSQDNEAYAKINDEFIKDLKK